MKDGFDEKDKRSLVLTRLLGGLLDPNPWVLMIVDPVPGENKEKLGDMCVICNTENRAAIAEIIAKGYGCVTGTGEGTENEAYKIEDFGGDIRNVRITQQEPPSGGGEPPEAA